MLQRGKRRAALAVSLLVGSVLNVINNVEQVLTHHAVDWSHVIANFVVRLLVSSYSAARAQVRRPLGS
jgi:hypothetical protein